MGNLSSPPSDSHRLSILHLLNGTPNAAAHIERFMGSLRRECLNHFNFLSEDHLRRTVTAYITYYNGGRPHQGIEGIPDCGPGRR